MVKSAVLTLAAIVASIGFFIFIEWHLDKEFTEFYQAAAILYEKTQNQTANREDANAVRMMWSDKRSKLHIFIPHNDISYIDYRLNEAASYIYTQDYHSALANMEIVRQLAKSVPGNYKLRLENIF